MALVTVKLDMAEALAEFKGIRDDQLPMAIARGITFTAKDAQASVLRELPLRFTLRKAGWMKANIKIVPALKADREPWASVEDTGGPQGQILRDMGLQEEGGEKLPTHGRWICVPILGGARKSRGASIRDEDLPGPLMKSGQGFIRGGVMFRRVFERHSSVRGFKGVGGFSGGSWINRIIPMYVLVTEAQIRKRYGFVETVGVVVQQMWPREFEAAFQWAVRTAR
jgi:hypothetical protein